MSHKKMKGTYSGHVNILSISFVFPLNVYRLFVVSLHIQYTDMRLGFDPLMLLSPRNTIVFPPECNLVNKDDLHLPS